MVYSRYRLKLTVMLGIFLTTVCSSLWAGSDINFKYVVIDENGPGDIHTKSVGDLNGDGLEDLLVAGTGGAIAWYENPSLVKHVITTKGGRWSTDAEIGDIDGDGDNDIVTSDWYQNNRIVWFENSGAGKSWTMHIIGQPKAHDIEIGDFDRDGDLDIVTRTQGGDGNKIQVWRQDSGVSWTRRASPISCPTGEGLTIADIDRDGDLDIVIEKRWYETPSNIIEGTFKRHIYSTSWTHGPVVAKTGDMNKDKKVDIVLTPSEGKGGSYRTSWFEAPADPTGNWTEHIIDNGIETVNHSLGVGDMDGDGDLDVVTAEMHQGANPDEVRVYINKGKGLSWKKQVVATTGSHNTRLVDLGGDGDLDIFGANWSGSKKVELWENLSGPYALSLDNWTYLGIESGQRKPTHTYVPAHTQTGAEQFILFDQMNGLSGDRRAYADLNFAAEQSHYPVQLKKTKGGQQR